MDPSQYDAVIVVIGETPYAEGDGDIGRRSLEAASLYPGDLAMLDRVSGKGVPVVDGAPLGPAAVRQQGAQPLRRLRRGLAARHRGRGRRGRARPGPADRRRLHRQALLLWPGAPCQTPLNVGDADYEPLFAYGYGLSNGETGNVGTLPEESQARCVDSGGGGTATEDLVLFDRVDQDPYKSYIGSPSTGAARRWSDRTP